MDETTKHLIDVTSQQAAERAAQETMDAIKPYLDEKVQEVKRHSAVRSEGLERQPSDVADMVECDDEKLEDHDRRFE